MHLAIVVFSLISFLASPAADRMVTQADELFNRACAADAAGDVHAAERLYRATLELDPAYSRAYNNLGNLLNNSLRRNQAETYYRKAIAADPRFSMAYTNLGRFVMLGNLRDRKRLDEAEGYCRKAIELGPENGAAYDNLGHLLRTRAEMDQISRDKNVYWEEAAMCYRKAMELDPAFNNAKTHVYLGDVLSPLGRMDEAERHYSKAIEWAPLDFLGYNRLGAVFEKQKRWKEAGLMFEKALQLFPSDMASRMRLVSLRNRGFY